MEACSTEILKSKLPDLRNVDDVNPEAWSSPGPTGVLEDPCSSAELDQTILQPVVLSQLQSAFTWPEPSSVRVVGNPEFFLAILPRPH